MVNYKELGLVNTRDMFARAIKGGYAIPAFNFNNMEQLQAIIKAAVETKSPVILQVSKGARNYANQTLLRYMAEGAVAYAKELGCEHPEIVLHLDHGDSFELCKSCIDLGFSSVMIDGSHLPYEENVALTKKVVEYAHQFDVTVEGELGVLAGVEDEVCAEHHTYTNPEEVIDLDDLLHHVSAQLLHADAVAVLAGDDHSIHTHGLVVLIVLHSDLALAIRTQIVHLAVLAHLGQALCQLVSQTDGHRHQLRGLIAGIAKHHALVACTADLIVGAKGDIGALAVHIGDDGAGVGVKAELGAGVADIGHDLADDLLEIDIAVGGDLAHDVHKAGGCTGLAGHTGIGVVGQNFVQNGIRDLVADLVGMSFGDGLRSKQVSCHKFCPPCVW